jgi:hypothetical protein
VAGDPVARRRRGGDGGDLGFISSVPAGWTSFLFRFWLGSRHLAAGADEAACGFSGAGKIKRKIKIPRARRSGIAGA